jgi:K+-sensing histidine kinase KdpD
LNYAKAHNAALVVAFVRQVSLSYKYDSEKPLTIDTDIAALKTFSRFLDLGHQMGVTVVPVYDTGPDAVELLAENAAIHGVDRILIGTSRKGAVYHFIKGHFQTRLESLLPEGVVVQVISPDDPQFAPEVSPDSIAMRDSS